jgi:drug/metabolite transporter (DMT)-like permease
LKKGMFYIVLSIIMASTMEIVMKLFPFHINAVQMNLWRFMLGTLALIPFSLLQFRKQKIRFTRKDFRCFCLTGFICVVLSMTLYQISVEIGKASVVAILFCCNSVFMVSFSVLILREKLYKGTILSLVVCILGILCIIYRQDSKNSFASCILVIISAMFYALYIVMGKKVSANFGPTIFTCLSFAFGCIELLLFILFTKIQKIAQAFSDVGLTILANIPVLENISLQNLIGLLYLGICVTGFGYLLYLIAVDRSSVIVASVVFYVKPVLAVVLAHLILGESITTSIIFGITLILFASTIKIIPVIKEIRRTQMNI